MASVSNLERGHCPATNQVFEVEGLNSVRIDERVGWAANNAAGSEP
jgi:hypothetical protein